MSLLQVPKDAGIATEAEGNRFQHRLRALSFGLGERLCERCFHQARSAEEHALPLEGCLPVGREKRQNNEPVCLWRREIFARDPRDDSAMGVQGIA